VSSLHAPTAPARRPVRSVLAERLTAADEAQLLASADDEVIPDRHDDFGIERMRKVG